MKEIYNDQPSGVPESLTAYLDIKISKQTSDVEKTSKHLAPVKSPRRRQNLAERLLGLEERLVQLSRIHAEMASGNYNGIQSLLDSDIELYTSAISWAQRKLETSLSDDDRFYTLQEKIRIGEQISSQLQAPEDIEWVSSFIDEYRQSLESTERVRTKNLLLREQQELYELQQLRALIPQQ